MTYTKPEPPEALDGERLVGRVKGDAIQLVSLVRDHGAETLYRILDTWGEDHVRRVILALAAAVDPDATPAQMWGWLGDYRGRISTSLPESDLWRAADPHAPTQEADTKRVSVVYSPAALARKQESARRAGTVSARVRRQRRTA